MRWLRQAVLLLLFTAGCLPVAPLAGSPTETFVSPQNVLVIPSSLPTLTPFVPLPTTALPTQTSTPSPSATPTHTVTPTGTFTPTPQPVIKLLFTGVIVPARCVQAAIDSRGNAEYIYDNVRELITGADLAVGVLNATISDYPPHTGCVQTYVLVGDARNAGALSNAGFDVMNVATNHIKNCGLNDCGDRAFFDTLENLQRANIQTVGAGENLEQALRPLVVTIAGIRIGFVALGMVEPLAFAGEATPGIAILNEDYLRTAIGAAQEVSDVVIAMPHWGPEDSPHPNAWQLDYARIAVDAGADLVVGNHTHVVQAIQEIDGILVFYGLGNFVFDQTWALDHQQGVILQVTFEGAQLIGYELIPTHVDGDGTVHIAGGQEANEILLRIEQASENLK